MGQVAWVSRVVVGEGRGSTPLPSHPSLWPTLANPVLGQCPCVCAKIQCCSLSVVVAHVSCQSVFVAKVVVVVVVGIVIGVGVGVVVVVVVDVVVVVVVVFVVGVVDPHDAGPPDAEPPDAGRLCATWANATLGQCHLGQCYLCQFFLMPMLLMPMLLRPNVTKAKLLRPNSPCYHKVGIVIFIIVNYDE